VRNDRVVDCGLDLGDEQPNLANIDHCYCGSLNLGGHVKVIKGASMTEEDEIAVEEFEIYKPAKLTVVKWTGPASGVIPIGGGRAIKVTPLKENEDGETPRLARAA
jgi:hypothetical protein